MFWLGPPAPKNFSLVFFCFVLLQLYGLVDCLYHTGINDVSTHMPKRPNALARPSLRGINIKCSTVSFRPETIHSSIPSSTLMLNISSWETIPRARVCVCVCGGVCVGVFTLNLTLPPFIHRSFRPAVGFSCRDRTAFLSTLGGLLGN